MKTNHINLCSSNVTRLTETLTRHFAYRAIDSGRIPDHAKVGKPGSEYAMLEGSDRFSIVITQIDPEPKAAYPAGFHFGIMLDEAHLVHAKHKELVDAGFQLKSATEFQALGIRWTAFYCPVGDGLVLEVNHKSA